MGPVAWDTILFFDKFPIAGKSQGAKRTVDRVGGSAGNIAQALASTGVETGFVTVLGEDDIGIVLYDSLVSSGIKHFDIIKKKGASGKCLVFVDDEGERTIVGYGDHILPMINLQSTPITEDDIVVFPNWIDEYIPDLKRANDVGCMTIVGISAITNPDNPGADIAIGSLSDFHTEINPREYLDRFSRIVYTRGVNGADQYEKDEVHHQEAFPATAIDTTGGGDAFLAGYLSGLAKGFCDGKQGMEAGARWAALMVSVEASVPPKWSEVKGSEHLFQ